MSKKTKQPINDDHVKDVINKTKTSEGVATETGFSKKTVEKKVTQGKLKLGFVKDEGDVNPPPVEQGQAQGVKGTVEVDYYATAYGFITFIDTMLWLVAKISRGALEYERLDKGEIEICANALKAETKVLDILASADWAVHIICLMQIIGVFSTKIKFKKKEKKKKDEKPVEPTKDTMKKTAFKDIDVKRNYSKVPTGAMGDATEVSPEVERNEEPIAFLESKDVGNYDSSDKDSQFVTPEVHDENYGNPPKGAKGLRQ